jgi:hypothetical protein
VGWPEFKLRTPTYKSNIYMSVSILYFFLLIFAVETNLCIERLRKKFCGNSNRTYHLCMYLEYVTYPTCGDLQNTICFVVLYIINFFDFFIVFSFRWPRTKVSHKLVTYKYNYSMFEFVITRCSTSTSFPFVIIY